MIFCTNAQWFRSKGLNELLGTNWTSLARSSNWQLTPSEETGTHPGGENVAAGHGRQFAVGWVGRWHLLQRHSEPQRPYFESATASKKKIKQCHLWKYNQHAREQIKLKSSKIQTIVDCSHKVQHSEPPLSNRLPPKNSSNLFLAYFGTMMSKNCWKIGILHLVRRPPSHSN